MTASNPKKNNLMKPIISSFPQPELNHVDEIFTEGIVVPDGDKRTSHE
jgi:hypothetical protein